jgi:hypothetical protein
VTTLAEALSALDGKAALTADDAITLRQIIYGQDQMVDQAEADALFRLNADAGQLAPEWCALFIEAMTDFVVRQQVPEGYVDDAKAEWLMGSVERGGRVRGDEIEMLVHVLEVADQVPAKLSAFALSWVKAMTLVRLQKTGAVSALDIDRLRRVVFAKGGESNVAVTRHEAETLFDINDAQADGPANPAWSDFFMRALANAVMFEPVWAPDKEAELDREKWLADTSIHPLRRIEAALEHPAESLGEMVAVLDGNWRKDDLAPFRDRYAADDAREAEAEVVTADEAHWLVDRIGRDGRFDANEHALINFLRANARGIDPALMAQLEGRQAASVEAAAAPATPVQFGHRTTSPGASVEAAARPSAPVQFGHRTTSAG